MARIFLLSLMGIEIAVLQLFTDASSVPQISCNKTIVEEGGSLDCECRANPPLPLAHLWWPGHSSTPFLTVTNVREDDNGTVFRCLMSGDGMENATADHTLLVASGPVKDELNISCSDPLHVTNGTTIMTLTCEAAGTFPTPQYSWGGLCASNTKSCTCQPRYDDDGKKVFCSVRNPVTKRYATVSHTMDLNYPPKEPPLIVVNTNKTELSSGDTLTCTVHGGKPLVQSVNFACTSPTLDDQDDQVNDREGWASSSVTVNTTQEQSSLMTCECSAVWHLDPRLYSQTSSMIVPLEYQRPAVDSSEGVPLAAVLVPVVLVVIAASVAVVIYILFSRRASAENGPVTCNLCNSEKHRTKGESQGAGQRDAEKGNQAPPSSGTPSTGQVDTTTPPENPQGAKAAPQGGESKDIRKTKPTESLDGAAIDKDTTATPQATGADNSGDGLKDEKKDEPQLPSEDPPTKKKPKTLAENQQEPETEEHGREQVDVGEWKQAELHCEKNGD